MVKFCFISFILFNFLFYCRGQSKNDLESKRASILTDIDETENLLSNTKHARTESLEKLELLDRKINLRNSVVNNLMTESLGEDKRIQELENITTSMSSDIKSIKKEYGHMIYLAYLNRNKDNPLIFILSASDFNQAYKRLLYIKQYSENRRRQIEIIRSIEKELVSQRNNLEKEKIEQLRLISSNKLENLKLKNEVEEKTELVSRLKLKEKELIKKLNEKNRIADKLQRAIEDEVKNELKKKNRASKDKLRSLESIADNSLGTNFNENKGKLPWPVDKGIVTSGFGEHPYLLYKDVKIRNNGIDISTTEGADVNCIFSGEVKAVFYYLGSNYSIIIRHGNFLSVYQNLVDVKVAVGDKVKTKQLLGKVFTDENSKSTVLHVEIWDELKNLNPEIWLSRR